MGPMLINIVVSFAAVVVSLTLVIVTTVPEIPVFRSVTLMIAIGVLLPILLYPFTYTLWLAIDLRAHPPTQSELDAARSALAVAATP